MPCKIATWNLCLGLQGKKIAVKEEILKNKIDICCMQETEIKVDFPTNILTFPGYRLEVETNDVKARVAIYISDAVEYNRRKDLEGQNSNIMIMDIKQKKNIKINKRVQVIQPSK